MKKAELEYRIKKQLLPYIDEVENKNLEMGIGSPESILLFSNVVTHLFAMAFVNLYDNEEDDVPIEKIAHYFDGIIECWSNVIPEIYSDQEFMSEEERKEVQDELNIRGIQIQSIVNKAKISLLL